MSGYAVARLDEIEEHDGGRSPWRAVRHDFGITAFGSTRGPLVPRATA